MTIPGKAAKLIIERLLTEITDDNDEILVTSLAYGEDIDSKIKALKEVMNSLPIRYDELITCIENDRDLENLDCQVRLVALADYCRAALAMVEAEIVRSERRMQ